MEKFSGRIGGLMFCRWVAQKNRRSAREPGGVSQQMMSGDRIVRGFDTKPRQVTQDGLVQIQFAFIAQLKKAQGDKALADGADLKKFIGLDASVGLQVSKSVSDHTL